MKSGMMALVAALFAGFATASVPFAGLSFRVPHSIDSSDLNTLIEQADFGPDQRAAAASALDAQVERWQHLRDETVRPFDRRVADLRSILHRGVLLQRPGESEKARDDDAADGSMEALDATAPKPDALLMADLLQGARALMQPMRQIFHRIESVEQEFIISLRAIAHSPVQHEAIDWFVQERQLAWSIAVHDSTSFDGGLFRNALLAAQVLSLPTPLHDPDVQSRVLARLRQLGQDHVALVHQAAVETLDGLTDRMDEVIDPLVRLRVRAIDDVASMLPPEIAEPWSDRQRLFLFRYLEIRIESDLSRSRLAEILGDGWSPPVMARFERWRVDRRKLEDELLMTKREALRVDDPTSMQALRVLDERVIDDIARISGVHDLRERLSKPSTTEAKVSESEQVAVDSLLPLLTRRTTQMHDWLMLRAPLNELHDKLAVPASEEALWQTLVDDFRDRAQKMLASIEAEPASIDAYTEYMKQIWHRLLNIEDEFFLTLQAVLVDVSTESIVLQHELHLHKRLVEEMRATTLYARFVDQSLMIVNPFAGTDGLHPDVIAAVFEPLRQWMARRAVDLRALRDMSETLDLPTNRMDRHAATIGEPPDRSDRRQARYAELLMASEQRAEQELVAILASMPEDHARHLHRSLCLRREPEIYRPLHEIESIFDRACARDNLDPDQSDRLRVLQKEHHDGAEELADRIFELRCSIRAMEPRDCIDRVDQATMAPERQADLAVERRQQEETAETRASDLAWDLREFNERSRRRLAVIIDLDALEPLETLDPPQP